MSKTLITTAAAAASFALVSAASAQIAQLTTDNLVYNFDADTATDGADWQSSAPASNTTAVFDTFRNTGGGDAASDAELVDVDTMRTFSQAFSFNGMPAGGNTEARFDIDPSSGPLFVDSFAGLAPNASFEVLVRPDDLVGNEIIFETGGTARGLSLALNGNTLYAFSKQGAGGDDSELVLMTTLTDLDVEDFAQVVYTTDGMSSHNLYVNGLLRDSSTLNFGDFGGGNVAALAANEFGGFGGLDGDGGGSMIDDASTYGALVGDIGIFRAYDDVLTPAEVAANFAAVVPEPASAGLLGVAGLALLRRRRA